MSSAFFEIGDVIELTEPFQIDYSDCLEDEEDKEIEVLYRVSSGERGVVISKRNEIKGLVRQAVRFFSGNNWPHLFYSDRYTDEQALGPGHYVPVSSMRLVRQADEDGLFDPGDISDLL